MLERIFHIVDAANWESVQRHGLLTTVAIAARVDRADGSRERLLSYRPKGVDIPGLAYVRDQAPMPPKALACCLDDGLTPEQWYELVNAHVFFWIGADRVRRHLRAMRKRPQIVLALDGRRLTAVYAESAFVTPFNVGAALRRPAQRGRRTLVPLAAWSAGGWASEAAAGRPPRKRSHPPAELLIRGSVPDVLHYMTDLHYESGAI